MIFIIMMGCDSTVSATILEALKCDFFRVGRQCQGKDHLVDRRVGPAADEVALSLIFNRIESDGDVVKMDAVFLAFFCLSLVNSFVFCR